MHNLYKSKAILLLAVILTFSIYQETPAQKSVSNNSKKAAAETLAKAPAVSYQVSMSKPWRHLLEVEMHVGSLTEKTELKMPVWTPGSYLIREYARHVQDFAAINAGGTALNWQKTNKNTWEIDTKGVDELVVTYRVYSNELTVRTNELNDEHGFWNNAALLMFVNGHLNISTTITVKPYGNWKVATGLPKVDGKADTFIAENYDVLYDSPFEVSDFQEFPFMVKGVPHRFVFTGEGNYDGKKIAADTTKIIEEAYKIFGELPYKNYTFIVNLRGGGGLEHLNSTALQFNRFGFKPKSRYLAFLGLVSHEYFHAFNVKRLRPLALGPFDYENENYTKLLWVAEGGTEYFSNLLMLRAGLISEKDFLSSAAAGIGQLEDRPGRFETSLEDASFDAWIKYYRQDENSINNQISYYDKGALVSMMLDVAIRTSSAGAKSLDDVMRFLYEEYYKKQGRGYTPEEFQKAAEQMAGVSLDNFFNQYVRGTAEIDYDSIFNGIGLTLTSKKTNAGNAYIGATLSESDGKLTIRSIPSDTPAYDQGLNTGDQLIAIDGYRATNSFVQSYIAEKKPGDKVKLTIFRFDKIRDITFTLGSSDSKTYEFAIVDSPTELKQRLYTEYLNAPLK